MVQILYVGLFFITYVTKTSYNVISVAFWPKYGGESNQEVGKNAPLSM